MFTGLEQYVIDTVESFGYIGITVLITAETVFPPIPSEAILPLAGFLAGQGRMSLAGVIVASTIGSNAGALILYGAGAWFGHDRLRRLIQRWGRFSLLKETDLDRADAWFHRHGAKAVLIGRMVPGVRSLISLPAGMTGMSLSPFLFYTTLGSAVWNGLLVGLGWWLGTRWTQVEGYVSYAQYAVIAGVLVAIIWFMWTRRGAWNR